MGEIGSEAWHLLVFFIAAYMIPAFFWGYGTGLWFGWPRNLAALALGLPVVTVLSPAVGILFLEVADAVFSLRLPNSKALAAALPLAAYVALAVPWPVGFLAIAMMLTGHRAGHAIAVRRGVAHD